MLRGEGQRREDGEIIETEGSRRRLWMGVGEGEVSPKGGSSTVPSKQANKLHVTRLEDLCARQAPESNGDTTSRVASLSSQGHADWSAASANE